MQFRTSLRNLYYIYYALKLRNNQDDSFIQSHKKFSSIFIGYDNSQLFLCSTTLVDFILTHPYFLL